MSFPNPKTVLEKKEKKAQKHNWNNHAKKMAYYFIFFRRFWVNEPRHSENNNGQKATYLYIVARVYAQL